MKLPLLAAQLCTLRALDDPIASNEPVDSNPATDQLQCPSTSCRSIRLFYCSNRGVPEAYSGRAVIATTPGC